MKIPTRFKLMGRTLRVEQDPALYHKDGASGWALYRQDKIILQPSVKGVPISEEALEQTFFHELMHHILYLAGEDQFDPPLHQREFLVDRIAGLLHQALATAEFED